MSGHSPKTLLENIRLEKALELLAKESCSAAARKAGYACCKTFRGAFKRRLGMTPTEYKRMLSSGNKKQLIKEHQMLLWKV